MIVYIIVMFAVAVVFGVVAVLIYKGKTDLIHDYHQKNVTDKKGYGEAFAKALAVIPVTMALSGAVVMLGESAMAGSVIILLTGLVAGTVGIIRVQNQYNGGLF